MRRTGSSWLLLWLTRSGSHVALSLISPTCRFVHTKPSYPPTVETSSARRLFPDVFLFLENRHGCAMKLSVPAQIEVWCGGCCSCMLKSIDIDLIDSHLPIITAPRQMNRTCVMGVVSMLHLISCAVSQAWLLRCAGHDMLSLRRRAANTSCYEHQPSLHVVD